MLKIAVFAICVGLVLFKFTDVPIDTDIVRQWVSDASLKWTMDERSHEPAVVRGSGQLNPWPNLYENHVPHDHSDMHVDPDPSTLDVLQDASPDPSPDQVVETRLVAIQGVRWGTDPLVLIYHTHTSESYRPSETFTYTNGEYHVWNDTDTGITRVGKAMADQLRDLGIPVIHSKDVFNYPSHPQAYEASRQHLIEMLEKHPSIMIVLDVHRQGIPDMRWTTTVVEQRAVKVELIYTTDQAVTVATDHEDAIDWRKNERFAEHLAGIMEEMYPGLLQKVTSVSRRRYNQDLFPNMLLVEVGNYLDLEDDAIISGRLMGNAIAATLYDLAGVEPPLSPLKGL